MMIRCVIRDHNHITQNKHIFHEYTLNGIKLFMVPNHMINFPKIISNLEKQ